MRLFAFISSICVFSIVGITAVLSGIYQLSPDIACIYLLVGKAELQQTAPWKTVLPKDISLRRTEHKLLYTERRGNRKERHEKV